MNGTCDDCRFSHERAHDANNEYYECRRYAHKGHGNWPLVAGDDWCGDFQIADEYRLTRLGGWNPETGLFDG